MAKNYDLENLKTIISKLEENEEVDNDTLTLIKEHINIVKTIGSYSFNNWRTDWRKSVYALGEKIKLVQHNKVILTLKELKEQSNNHEKEVIDFYISEIKHNSKTTDYKYFKKLSKKYPHNAEFFHTYGIKLYSKDKSKSLENLKTAALLDKKYSLFKDDYYNNSINKIDELIQNHEYNESLKLTQELQNSKLFIKDPHYHNYLISLKKRIKDHIEIDSKINQAKEDLKRIVTTESIKQQSKTYEALGFFTAVIALIFTTISIGKNFKFDEALIFITSLGVVLLIFALFLSLLLSNQNDLKREKIIGIIFLCILLLFILSRFCLTILF